MPECVSIQSVLFNLVLLGIFIVLTVVIVLGLFGKGRSVAKINVSPFTWIKIYILLSLVLSHYS